MGRKRESIGRPLRNLNESSFCPGQDHCQGPRNMTADFAACGFQLSDDSKMEVTGLRIHDSNVHDICTFAILYLIRSFDLFSSH